jgi:N-acetylglucosamine-6-sulfatase
MRPPLRFIALALAISLAALLSLWAGPTRGATGASDVGSPNIVVIVTDDQRWDTLWAMPTLQSEIVAKGVTFANAFAVNPTCCPSRASILTGQYSNTTGVYTNKRPDGGFPRFEDESTIATWLDAAGYQTALSGKYLNLYSNRHVTYLPPGWDRWFAMLTGASEEQDFYYFNYDVSDQGSLVEFGFAETDYSTDVFADRADAFIRGADPGSPLFLLFTPVAPHYPAFPADRHETEFSELEDHRPPNYNEEDVSDKPAYVQNRPLMDAKHMRNLDNFRKRQYRTLLAVDEAIATILAALTDTGRLGDTMIVFTSDNGLTWGEHRWVRSKLLPYEEVTRVPLVIRYDPLTASSGVDSHLVANIDLTPTLAELAGIEAPSVQGMSLMPLLASAGEPWRTEVLIEHLQSQDPVPTYCALRNESYVYVTYSTGEEELYDLALDPYQLDNRTQDGLYTGTVMALRTSLVELCDPPPPGFEFPYDAVHPTAPTGLAAFPVGPRQVDLSWQAATDDVGVTAYTIYRDDVELATMGSDTLTYTDASVADSTTYTYTVDALDGAGNRSIRSDPISVTTPEDLGPAAPTDLSAVAVSPRQVDLSWSPSTDDVGVAGYTVYRDGVELVNVDGATLAFSDLSVSPATTYTYTVDAVDGSGNRSPPSNPVTVTTLDESPSPRVYL